MVFRKIPSEDYRVSDWSGGQTTEIFIYPESSDYATRQFDVRISSATINTETSDFTALPGYHRILMVLEGKTHLSHENVASQRDILLNRFMQDSFAGSENTCSVGRCRDFNLMYKEGQYQGEIHSIINGTFIVESTDHYVIYAVKNLICTIGESQLTLDAGDALWVCQEDGAVRIEQDLNESDVSAVWVHFRKMSI